MQVETALLFETVEQIYERVFRSLRPRTPLPAIVVHFRKYANANSRIKLAAGTLTVNISDLLQDAPAPIQESLAYILLAKLYRKQLDVSFSERYRRYLNRSDVRSSLRLVKQVRGRKLIRDPKGQFYNLTDLFESLNHQHFGGMMARPQLGWSLKPSRTTLGHYDPSHHAIVLSSLLDTAEAPASVVEYVMFHEMLHLRYPTEQRARRRCVHTAEFKAAERTYPHYRQATAELKQFLGEVHQVRPD